MFKKVEIYSKSNCYYCEMAKKYFDLKNVDYELYNTDDQNIFDELMKRNPAARTMPQIFIENDLVGGYTDLIEKYGD